MRSGSVDGRRTAEDLAALFVEQYDVTPETALAATLEPLEEFLQFLFSGVGYHVVFDLIIVKSIDRVIGKIRIAGTSERPRGFCGKAEATFEKLEDRHEALLAVDNLELLGRFGGPI